MTYREKLLQEHPENVDEKYIGGCQQCPYDYGYENKRWCSPNMSCEECWGREVIEHKALTGICPNCHKQNPIDPLVRFCCYCGTRLEDEND